MGTLLGIDIGTTGVRAAIFGERGERLAEAGVPCPPTTPSPGWAEADPEAWWTAAATAVRQAAAAGTAQLEDVTCVAVVGQAPTAVLVDAAGAVVRPAVLWLDTRADAEARAMGSRAYYLGPKLAWLQRHEPAAFAQTHVVLQSHAFVALRLTGEAAIDRSTAALSAPLFDLARLAWKDDAVFDQLGIPRGVMPEVRRAHDVLGAVTPRAAAATGLRPGTRVVVGGGDFAAATLGAGVVREGEACLMLGTAGNLLLPRRTPGSDPRLIEAHHVGTDAWLSLGGTLAGGAQEWLRQVLVDARAPEGASSSRELPPFDVLDAEASRVPAGAEGLLFLPYLQGERTPIWNVDARGAYVGLGLGHGRGHLWRALLEGVALGFADCQDVVESDGVRLREIVAANGGGKSALFRQILCDVLGVPLAYAADAGGTVAGAAILAALGSGALSRAEEARAWRGEVLIHEPDRAKHARYRELLAIRRDVYAGLQGVFRDLAVWRDAREQ